MVRSGLIGLKGSRKSDGIVAGTAGSGYGFLGYSRSPDADPGTSSW
jgi:hypothetical protein